MLSKSLHACWLASAALAIITLGGEPLLAQGTQLGSHSEGRTARLAQYEGPIVDDSGGMMGQPEMVMQPGGGDVWGDDCYEQQGWSSNVFGVPSGQSCQGRGAGFIAGGGVYFIKPMWTNNQAGFIAEPTAPGAVTFNTTRLDIDSDHEWAPFVFAGFVGPNGFGVRGKAWVYDQAANDTSVTIPAGSTATVFSQSPLGTAFGPNFPPFPPGINTFAVADTAPNTLRVSSNLEMYVYDLEAIQAIDYEQWTWTFSGGVRYAVLRQGYVATGTSAAFFAAAGATTTVNSLQRFDGWGPTLSLEGRRSFGQTGLAFYGNARGSMLFGDTTQTVTQTVLVPPGAAVVTTHNAARWTVRPVVELEVGGEYGFWLGGTFRLFARAGLVGQAWFNAGNAANAGLDGSADDNATLGFTGYRATFGVDY